MSVTTAYARGFGSSAGSPATSDAGGVAADLTLGFRIPSWAVALVGGYGELDTDRGERVHTANGGIALTYHFTPSARFDPWIRGSTGYRFAEDGSRGAHGLQLGQLQLGGDLRASQIVAVGPVVGFEVDAFPWLRVRDGSEVTQLYGCAFMGLVGRFDLGPGVPAD